MPLSIEVLTDQKRITSDEAAQIAWNLDNRPPGRLEMAWLRLQWEHPDRLALGVLGVVSACGFLGWLAINK